MTDVEWPADCDVTIQISKPELDGDRVVEIRVARRFENFTALAEAIQKARDEHPDRDVLQRWEEAKLPPRSSIPWPKEPPNSVLVTWQNGSTRIEVPEDEIPSNAVLDTLGAVALGALPGRSRVVVRDQLVRPNLRAAALQERAAQIAAERGYFLVADPKEWEEAWFQDNRRHLLAIGDIDGLRFLESTRKIPEKDGLLQVLEGLAESLQPFAAERPHGMGEEARAAMVEQDDRRRARETLGRFLYDSLGFQPDPDTPDTDADRLEALETVLRQQGWRRASDPLEYVRVAINKEVARRIRDREQRDRWWQRTEVLTEALADELLADGLLPEIKPGIESLVIARDIPPTAPLRSKRRRRRGLDEIDQALQTDAPPNLRDALDQLRKATLTADQRRYLELRLAGHSATDAIDACGGRGWSPHIAILRRLKRILRPAA